MPSSTHTPPNHRTALRVLSGIQPSGRLHLGNYTGAVQQFLDLQEQGHDPFIFVATYHAMTTIDDAATLRDNVRAAATDYLAFGLDPDRCTLYLQQDVPAVTELAWILGCVCPKSQMDKATTFKDKVAKGLSASIGLYTYPVLQAADILAVDPDLVPVGRDQAQHVEIARDLGQKFNRRVGDTVLKIPKLQIREDAAVVPGIDGQKMSKSYGNTIDPFMDEKPLRKRIMKVVTDSAQPGDVKDPEASAVYQIFSALAGADDPRTLDLAQRYREPARQGPDGFGYGHAKQALFELVMDTFAEARARRTTLEADPGQVDEVLRAGAARANDVIAATLSRVRRATGLD